MKRTYKIQSNSIHFKSDDWIKIKQKEAFCKGLREDYIITFPDGYKMTAKFEGI